MRLFELKRSGKREEPRAGYLAVIAIFLALQIVGPLLPSYYESFFINAACSFLIISFVFTLNFRRSFFLAALSVALLAVALNSLMLMKHSIVIEFFYIALVLFFFGVITVILFRRVFLSSSGDDNPIFGSISIYILLGVIWAFIYSLIDLFWPESFQGTSVLRGEDLNQVFKFQPFIYYSFVTQTTLGYGDIIPVTPLARNLSTIQAIMGQFYLAVLVAGLLGIMIREKRS